MNLGDVAITVVGLTLIGWGVAWLLTICRDVRRRWHR